MNSTPILEADYREKHQAGVTYTLLIDKSGRIRWCSGDPLNPIGGGELLLTDLAPESEREKLFGYLSRTMLASERQSFVMLGYKNSASPDDGLCQYLVELMPTGNLLVTVATVCVIRRLPSYWDGVNEDDRSILNLLAQDSTLKQVASATHLSESGLDTRIRKLKTKLGVENIGGLVSTAIRNFLV